MIFQSDNNLGLFTKQILSYEKIPNYQYTEMIICIIIKRFKEAYSWLYNTPIYLDDLLSITAYPTELFC